MGFLDGFGAGEVAGAVNDFYQGSKNRKQSDKESKRSLQSQREDRLLELLLTALATDTDNARRQSRFDQNMSTGFLQAQQDAQFQRMAPKLPVDGFRAPGEAPGPGGGSGTGAGIDYSALNPGFQEYSRMRRAGQSTVQAPAMAQDPLQVAQQLSPEIMEHTLRAGAKKPGDPNAVASGRASMNAGAQAPVDPEEENKKKLTKIFSELLNKGVGI